MSYINCTTYTAAMGNKVVFGAFVPFPGNPYTKNKHNWITEKNMPPKLGP